MNWRRLFILLLFPGLIASLSACSVNPPGENARPYSVRDKDGTVRVGTLVNGVWEGPVEFRFANGNVGRGRYNNGKLDPAFELTGKEGRLLTGTLVNGKWEGPSELRDADGNVTRGSYKNGLQEGVFETLIKVNGLKTYNVYEAGKLLTSYSELDALLATGRYDDAYRIRGSHTFLGLNFNVAKEAGTGLGLTKVILNSPAFLAGLLKSDRITAVDGQNISEAREFQSLLAKVLYGQEIRLAILRDGKQQTVTLVPAIIPSDYKAAPGRQLKPTAQLLWDHYRARDTARDYQQYLDTIADETYHPQARARLNQLQAEERVALASAVKTRTVTAMANFLRRFPATSLQKETEAAVQVLLDQNQDKGSVYVMLTDACNSCGAYFPAQYGLLTVGPEGLKINDVLRLVKRGLPVGSLAAKIEGSAAKYKDFSLDEIAFLNSLGMPDAAVSAMIKSTYAHDQKQLQEANKQMSDANRKLAADNDALRRQLASAPAAPAAPEQEDKSMPAECLKLVVALRACDQAGGFIKMGCKVMARSSFECPVPVND